ncbi:unnamed protein product [Psylliodes chrysocephalus]|uniref:Uncharacterized protein n=1 Tax=Psylliodes chrysocephalus TaxID=3402493 RepID=A0A9P0D5V2_9CUCU|nr:unnamed protein product [Psylliodes chrysocephala]
MLEVENITEKSLKLLQTKVPFFGAAKKYIEKIKKRKMYYKKIKARNIFRRKIKSVALADQDYGLQAQDIQQDLDEKKYEDQQDAFLRDLEKNRSELIDLEINTRGQGGNPL